MPRRASAGQLLLRLATTCAHVRIERLSEALLRAERSLAAAGVPEARLSAEHLLSRAAGFGTERGALLAALDKPLPADAAARFDAMCARRLRRVPVQYILGDWDFHDITLQVAPPVLIPRPETEELVEHVIAWASSRPEPGNLRMLDVGCGSGAIGLALLRAGASSACTGLDVSAEACALATENAAALGLGDRFTTTMQGVASYAPTRRYDLLVSNPPYIPAADMETLEPEVREHEDARALCGGVDGADVIRDLLSSAPRLLTPEAAAPIFLEIDPSHPPIIEAWLKARPLLGITLRRVLKDAAGRDRFLHLEHTPR